ncbi:hypothetical protein GCK32_020956, partial [Trichostrongylus colubriformis]
ALLKSLVISLALLVSFPFHRMIITIWVLSLVGTIIAKDPIGQNIIVLLIDGYGASLMNETKPETKFGMQQLMANGVQAEYLRSTFPTHSWPNWISLATGNFSYGFGKLVK